MTPENLPVPSDAQLVDADFDASPFLEYLQSDRGHETLGRVISIVDDIKKASLQQSAGHARLEKWLQISIVVTVILSATFLTYFDKMNPTIGVLFGTLVGYVFGKRS